MTGLLKKILVFHIVPVCLALAACFAASGMIVERQEPVRSGFSAQTPASLHNFDKFYPNDITHEMTLALAFRQRVPVLFGSSELTSHHLPAIAYRFFCRENSGDRFLAVGHAGNQCLAMLTTLAANRPLLKDAKIAIILSPGWFEKQYASGTSLTSFFEYCPPDYLYQIHQDEGLDAATRSHIKHYICANYDKITRPDAVLRAMGKKEDLPGSSLMNFPFHKADELEIRIQAQRDFYLVAQHAIVSQLSEAAVKPYKFENRALSWDSLFSASERQFKTISNGNELGVENSYYDNWLKNRPKKRLEPVALEKNQEYKDFLALLHFLEANQVRPLFIIMPLNTLAHQNLEVMKPTIDSVAMQLNTRGFVTLNMFEQNLTTYRKGVLEDIMHPYDLGWYQIDQFILNHYHDE